MVAAPLALALVDYACSRQLSRSRLASAICSPSMATSTAGARTI